MKKWFEGVWTYIWFCSVQSQENQLHAYSSTISVHTYIGTLLVLAVSRFTINYWTMT